MLSTSPDRRGKDLKKVFSRHYHKTAKTAETTNTIDSKSRRDIEILRRRNRSRLMKWCAIGFILLSLALAGILYLAKLP